jgi:hypothetical protein
MILKSGGFPMMRLKPDSGERCAHCGKRVAPKRWWSWQDQTTNNTLFFCTLRCSDQHIDAVRHLPLTSTFTTTEKTQ